MSKRIATLVALGLLLAGCAYDGSGVGYSAYGPGVYGSYGYSYWGYPGANSSERTASPAATYGG